MLTAEKQKEWDALAAGNPEMAEMMLGLLKQTAATDKAAQGRVAFKEQQASQQAPAVPQEIVVNGVTYKAMPMAEEKAPPPAAAEMADMAAEDADMDAAEDAATDGMDDAGFAQLVAKAVIDALAPMLDMEKKMAGYVSEMKGLLAGGATKEVAVPAVATPAQSDLLTKMQQQLAAFETQLKELSGDQPAAVPGSNRSSQADETSITDVVLKEHLTNPAGQGWLDQFTNNYLARLQGGAPPQGGQ